MLVDSYFTTEHFTPLNVITISPMESGSGRRFSPIRVTNEPPKAVPLSGVIALMMGVNAANDSNFTCPIGILVCVRLEVTTIGHESLMAATTPKKSSSARAQYEDLDVSCTRKRR